jgi:hypothetical protein
MNHFWWIRQKLHMKNELYIDCDFGLKYTWSVTESFPEKRVSHGIRDSPMLKIVGVWEKIIRETWQ